jgi:hypothetical protein
MREPISPARWGPVRRVRLLLRARHAISTLEAPVAEHDSVPRITFGLSFLVHCWIGSEIQRRDAFKAYNYFFNADCPRVIDDMLRSHRKVPSDLIANAHPLFALFTAPITGGLEAVFRDSGALPARLLCHAAAAGAAAVAYRVFRALGAPRWFAAAATAAFALSTTELVLGSIVETFSFVSLVLAVGVLVAVRSVSPFRNAFAQVLALGVNTTLLPHTLFFAPVLWLGRVRFGRWVRTTLIFVAAVAGLAIALTKFQEWLYPGTGFFFQKDAVHAYRDYWSIPKTKAAFDHRAARLIPHFFAFAFVAPMPFLTDAPDKMTTFMWEQKDAIARYDGATRYLAALWCTLGAVATASNVYALFRGDATRRAQVIALAGWLFGSFGFFMVFGDDLLLFSPFWVLHWFSWVVVGLVPLIRTDERREPWLWACAAAYVFALALGNAAFVERMLGHYG